MRITGKCVCVYCSVLQCVAVCCVLRVAVCVVVCVAVCCNALQCVAVCCSVLQYVAVCCHRREWVSKASVYVQNKRNYLRLYVCHVVCASEMYVRLCVSTASCSVIFLERVSCSVCQRRVWYVMCIYSVTQCVAVCCNMLQCVAVCCSVLLCVAVCCSVLQYVIYCASTACNAVWRVLYYTHSAYTTLVHTDILLWAGYN